MSAKYKAKGVMRSAKNFTKGYSDIEIKVRDSTSNDPILPSGILMSEIAAATNNSYMFLEIMGILDKRLNDKGKNWRHVYKALILLDFLLHSGSEEVSAYVRENMFIVRTLQQFQYIDENGRDYGMSVRTKAQEMISLLENPDRLSNERHNPSTNPEKYADMNLFETRYQNEPFNYSRNNSSSSTDLNSTSSPPSSYSARGATRPDQITRYSHSGNEDLDMMKAIEESKKSAERDEKRRKEKDDELRKALELSREEAQMSKLNETKGSNEDLMDLFEGPQASSIQDESYYDYNNQMSYQDNQQMYQDPYNNNSFSYDGSSQMPNGNFVGEHTENQQNATSYMRTSNYNYPNSLMNQNQSTDLSNYSSYQNSRSMELHPSSRDQYMSNNGIQDNFLGNMASGSSMGNRTMSELTLTRNMQPFPPNQQQQQFQPQGQSQPPQPQNPYNSQGWSIRPTMSSGVNEPDPFADLVAHVKQNLNAPSKSYSPSEFSSSLSTLPLTNNMSDPQSLGQSSLSTTMSKALASHPSLIPESSSSTLNGINVNGNNSMAFSHQNLDFLSTNTNLPSSITSFGDHPPSTVNRFQNNSLENPLSSLSSQFPLSRNPFPSLDPSLGSLQSSMPNSSTIPVPSTLANMKTERELLQMQNSQFSSSYTDPVLSDLMNTSTVPGMGNSLPRELQYPLKPPYGQHCNLDSGSTGFGTGRFY